MLIFTSCPVASGIASQFHKPNGFGGRCATLAMNVMNRAQYDKVMKELPLQGRILDIGFGNGRMLKRILQKGCREAYGTEISESCMSAVERKLLPALQMGYLKLHTGTAEALPYEAAFMDAVYSINTIYFWDTLDKGMKEISRILKPGGTLLLAFYDKRWMTKLSLDLYGFHLYEPEDIYAALKQNGFDSITMHVIKQNKAYCVSAKRADAKKL